MDAIRGMLASFCTVVRDGAEQRIPPSQLVPGDIVRLSLGDRVPADLRVIATTELKTVRCYSFRPLRSAYPRIPRRDLRACWFILRPPRMQPAACFLLLKQTRTKRCRLPACSTSCALRRALLPALTAGTPAPVLSP